MKSIVQIFIVAILQKLPICCMGINYLQEKQETGCSIVSVGLLTVGHYNESKRGTL